MMDNLKIIYRILMAIQASMDYDEFDCNSISPEVLHVSEQRRDALIAMIVEEGLVDGIEIMSTYGGNIGIKIMGKPRLTLKGLTYLEDNSTMAKASKAVKYIAEIAHSIK